MSKRAFIGGNWKCNPASREKIKSLCDMLHGAPAIPPNVDVVVAPTLLHLASVQSALASRSDVAVSAQNLWTQPKAGAWTGEITADILTDHDISWVILGHSERRKYANEGDAMVAEKVRVALSAGISTIVCCGELPRRARAGHYNECRETSASACYRCCRRVRMEQSGNCV